ncbi:MAG: galactitol-1-phosphate 5-dehydrogenase [Spirochaetaceae bacterium]|jgi:(R,R)-butanediol dehydrogenase/meso-butanediol dehydrogenase/diacetyl reductase/L-iditol 2-dehydrogenase|nr:galactitol-1-phosphate 5-dehydrogenase [Spirochaetaceae bacterium]
MKALVLTQYKKLDYLEVDTPELCGARELLVRVKAAAVCGSDVHGFDGSTGRRKPPVIMGHEASAEVVETGKEVSAFKRGDRITFDSTIYCGECYFCRAGQVNLCDNRRVLGVSCDEYKRDGVFAEYAVVPDHICYALPDALSFEEAALTEPAAVAAHAIRITPLSLNENAAVVGAGLIGLLVLQCLRPSVSGKIIALDTESSRREAALEAGADFAFDPREPDTLPKIRELTGGRGVDRAFEAVGAAAPVETAIAITRKGGSVTLIGNISPKIEIPLQSVVTRQISLFGSCAIAGEYPIVLDMMARKKLDVRRLISRTAPLCEGQIWFDKLYKREDNLLKVVLIP